MPDAKDKIFVAIDGLNSQPPLLARHQALLPELVAAGERLGGGDLAVPNAHRTAVMGASTRPWPSAPASSNCR